MIAPRWFMLALLALPAALGRRATGVYVALCPICNLARLMIWARRWLTGLLLPRLAVAAVGQGGSVLVMLAIANLVAYPLATTAARADVASAMESFYVDTGAAANANGPTAYQGQEAGYYTAGNLWMRFPQKNTNLFNLQLPKATGGCGGIDLFAGSFSFVNSAQLIALLKSIANNAVGFAFKLAIDTVCPECSKVMEEMRQAVQQMNNQSINSCQMAAGLVGSVWPKSDMADREICNQFGNSTGVFSDMAASMAGCGTGGRRTDTLNAAAHDAQFKDVTPGVPRNYTWHMMQKSPFFAPGGTMDRELAEYVMTIVGTIIYVPPKDGAAGVYNPIEGDTSTTLLTALLDGTAATGPVKIWTCDQGEADDACTNPTLTSLSIDATKAVRPRVKSVIDGMLGNMITDTALTPAMINLLQLSSLPLYKILAVQAAAGRGAGVESTDTLAEITSIDMLIAIVDQMMAEVGKTRSTLIAADAENQGRWQQQFVSTRLALGQREQNMQSKVSAVMQVIQRTQFLETTLAQQMAPSMAASVDWSRSMGSHGIVN